MDIQALLIALPILFLSVVVHEYAHARVAYSQGDPTAWQLGRMTLNPVVHVDLVGSIVVPLALFLMHSPFLFGWAKPVPINSRNFRSFRKGDILVSLAGVTANFLLAMLFSVILAILIRVLPVGGSATLPLVLAQMASYGIVINLVLCFFNLIPIPPLDGSHILWHALPANLALQYRSIGRYGFMLIVLLMYLGVLRIVLAPATWLYGFILSLIGVQS